MTSGKNILDVCCGAKMCWFDKHHKNTIYMDNRETHEILCDSRHFDVKPDIIGDFKLIPYQDETFSLVLFDPPHLLKVGEKSWLAKKYGKLNPDTYKSDLKTGFMECFRVLKINGILVFKWNETDIKTTEIINLSPYKPLFGHKSGKSSKTHWIVFMKEKEPGDERKEKNENISGL